MYKYLYILFFLGLIIPSASAQVASSSGALFEEAVEVRKILPPYINNPVVADEKGSMYFSWDKPEGVASDQWIQYEVLLKKGDQILYSKRTHQTNITVSTKDCPLQRNTGYTFVVNALVSNDRGSYSTADQVNEHKFVYLPAAPLVTTPRFYANAGKVRTDCDYVAPASGEVHRILMRVRSGNNGTWVTICDSIETYLQTFTGNSNIPASSIQVQLKRTSYTTSGTPIDPVGTWVNAASSCEAPITPAITLITASSFSLTCNTPNAPPGFEYIYEIKYKLTSNSTWITASPTALPATVNGINGANNYDVTLTRKCNVVGQQLFIPTTPHTMWWPICVGGMPAGRAKFNQQTSFTVSTGTFVRCGYFYIRYREVNTSTWTEVAVPGLQNSLTNYVVNGIDPNKTYEVELKHVCNGSGFWYPINEIICLQYVNPAISNITDNTFIVSANGEPINLNCSETVRYRLNSNQSWTNAYEYQCGGTPTTITANNTQTNSNYWVEINKECTWTGVNDDGTPINDWVATAWQPVSYPQCTPAPTNPSITINNATSFTVNWTHQNTAWSWLEKRYQVRYKLTSSGTWTTLPVVTGTSQVVTVPNACQTYNVEIRPVCFNPQNVQVLQGNWAVVNWPGSSTGGCAEPVSPSITVNSSTSFTLNWTPGANNPCNTNNQYKVRYRVQGSGSAYTELTVATTSATITGVNTCQAYEVGVQKLCTINGQNSFSAWVTANWPAGSGGSCPAPLNPVLTIASSTSFTTSWTAPTADPCDISTSYKVRYRVAGSGSAYTEQTVNATTLTVTGVNACQAYEVSVQKLCSINSQSSASTWVDFSWPTLPTTCPAPVNVTGTWPNSTKINLKWSYPSIALCDVGTQFTVRYKLTSESTWTEITTSDTTLSLTNLSACGNYQVEVKRNCVFGSNQQSSTWVSASLGSCSTLPTLSCGDSTNVNTACNGILITDPATSFDIIEMSGFPIKVTANAFSNGVWAGEGIAPLPFSSRHVKVSWTNLTIGTDNRVCSGQITGVSDVPPYLPDLNPGPIAFGGEICLPPPSTPGFNTQGIHSVTGLPWDERGFGPNGTYEKMPPYPGYQPGEPYDTTKIYDPNGFNAQGINAITGTQFNPQGCNQNGIDSLGQPCNPNIPPYSWMNPGEENPTQAGLQYAQQQADSLIIKITAILNTMKTNNMDTVNIQRNQCNQIRTVMETTLTATQFDREFIFGANDAYFAEGLHKKFISAPQPFPTNMDRVANVVTLETKHIELYHCDKGLFNYINKDSVLLEFLTAPELALLKIEILAKIKVLPASKINEFIQTPSKFILWLKEILEGKVDEEIWERFPGYGFTPTQQTPEMQGWSAAPKVNNNPGEWLALQDNDPFTALILKQAMEKRQQDIEFEYLQGMKVINGVHRAHYIDALVKERWAVPTLHDSLLMPIDITNRGTDGKKYSVYLDNLRYNTNGAKMDVYAVLELPGNGQKLVFEAHDVPFKPWGLSALPLKIELGTDVHVRLSNSARLTLKAGPKTYVAFDCGGFNGLGVAVDVELCRNIVLPYDPVTDQVLPDPQRVKGHFETSMPNLDEFFVTFKMDPFVIPGYEDIKFVFDSVSLDMSESVSPTGAPPQGYETELASAANGFTPLWKGFYIKNLSVILPKKFSSGNQPITVGVEKVVIDDMGVSGSIYATNLLPISQGNAGGWAFSVDTFKLTVVMNSFEDARFAGLIHVPIFRDKNNTTGALKTTDCFKYGAFIRPGGLMEFKAYMPSGVEYAIDMWKTNSVTLSKCGVEMVYENGEFEAVATISGAIVVKGNLSDNVNLNVPEITFEDVQVSNKEPYFSPGTWSFPNQVGCDFGGFEFSVKDIKMIKTEDNEPALSFGAAFSLGDSEQGLSADGSFQIVGEMQTLDGKQRWKYKKFKITELQIDASLPAVKINGYVKFFENHSVYGKGFQGGLGATFNLMQSSIQVVGLFGKVNGYKYFLIDAMYCGNIPMAGAITINGLGGGVYYHMDRPTQAFSLPACTNAPIPTGIGQTLSGITYTPDESKGIGFKITIAASIAKKEAFNFNATYEMLFNTGGGVSNIWIYGNCKMMETQDMQAAPSSGTGNPNNGAPFSAFIDLGMDFNTKEFHGNIQMYANFNGGAVQGAGPGGLMGDVAIRFTPSEWYIHIGKPWQRDGSPDKRLGLKLNIPGFGSLAELRTYMQIGSKVDPLPPMPSEITSLTGVSTVSAINNGSRGGNVATGAGFAFGAELDLGNKDYTFLMFTAGLRAKLGFDMALNDMGTSAICAETGEPIGINGWYAQGQAYAGVWAKVGIKVKVFGSTKSYNILDLAAAAALEAKLPNPFWARGSVGGQYNILNGLVKGQCNFQFTIGQLCTVEGVDDQYTELPLISATNPTKDQTGVSVQINPTVTFNFPIDKPFTAPDLTSGGNQQFTLRLVYANLKYDNFTIPVNKEFSADKKELTLKPDYILPGNDTILLEVKVYVDSLGINVQEETRLVKFVTGPGLVVIPPVNIEGSYPLNGQYNFYKNEITSGKGYIDLIKGQPDLFFNTDISYELLMRFTTKDGVCVTTPAEYISTGYKILFDIPSSSLVANKVYRMQLIRAPRTDLNWGPGIVAPGPCDAPNSNSVSSADAPTIKILYTGYFRVSQHGTFKQKVEAMEPGFAYGSIPGTNSFKNTFAGEPFDQFELFGDASMPPLVSIRADLINTPWYNLGTMNNLYEQFPGYVGSTKIQYEGTTYNFPPDNAVQALQSGSVTQVPKITLGHYMLGSVTAPSNTSQYILYDVPAVINDQLLTLKQKTAQVYQGFMGTLSAPNGICNGQTTCSCMEIISSQPAPLLTAGPRNVMCTTGTNAIQVAQPTPGNNYKAVFSYRLPGINQVSSIKTVNLKR